MSRVFAGFVLVALLTMLLLASYVVFAALLPGWAAWTVAGADVAIAVAIVLHRERVIWRRESLRD